MTAQEMPQEWGQKVGQWFGKAQAGEQSLPWGGVLWLRSHRAACHRHCLELPMYREDKKQTFSDFKPSKVKAPLIACAQGPVFHLGFSYAVSEP